MAYKWGTKQPEHVSKRVAAIRRAREIAKAKPGEDVEVEGEFGMVIRFAPQEDDAESGQELVLRN